MTVLWELHLVVEALFDAYYLRPVNVGLSFDLMIFQKEEA